MKNKSATPDVNTIETTIAEFLSYYNSAVPESYPKATLIAMEKFKETHSSLFGSKGTWSRDKHRKKLMDWLFSYKD